jgi:Protein of unknown function (DUF1275)
MAVARADWRDVLLAGVIIGSFVVGACLATLICEVSNRFEILAVLNSELLIFLVALALAAGAYDRTALVLVALAMGAQNTLHQIVAGADVGKGFITGTLFAFGQSLAFWLRRRKTDLASCIKPAVMAGIHWRGCRRHICARRDRPYLRARRCRNDLRAANLGNLFWPPVSKPPVIQPNERLHQLGVALAVSNFRRYVSGQALSLIGTWVETVAQGLLVQDADG